MQGCQARYNLNSNHAKILVLYIDTLHICVKKLVMVEEPFENNIWVMPG